MTPKALVLDLLAANEAAVPVAALIRAADLFGIRANALRVAISRMQADELVVSDAHGSYRAGPRALDLNRQKASWRRREETVSRWSGGWLAACTQSLDRSDRATVRRAERALRLLGFAELCRGLAVRPDNLRGGAAGARARLRPLGWPDEALLLGVRALDGEGADPTALWDPAALHATYRRRIRLMEASAARLPALSEDDALREALVVGGETLRVILFDPLLPEEMVDVRLRRRMVETMRRYDAAGRVVWDRLARQAAA